MGFFAIPSPPDASPNETPLLSKEGDYKLPLADNLMSGIFIAARRLPIWPVRNWNIPEPQLTAKIALVYDTDSREILYQKNGLNERHPIASLTKLMTGLVVMENAKPDAVFKVSKKAVETYGEIGNLVVGEELTVANLLYALLVESSNDAAVALAENILAATGQNLTDLMNKKAIDLGLANTHFADSSGLDPQNYSTAWDLTKIIQEVLKYPLLAKIMQTQSIDVLSVDGRFNHHLTATNKLLGKIPEIIGGKTGYIEEAGNCMIVAFKSPMDKGYLIAVVMKSQNRLAEIETLIKWTKEAYLW
ncbi:MAG: D-alanyl-D-alanine carboxypeptidase (penicillin-binding protein 5/6) [Parcubacteria group bacterium LiPW_39]|nr:MAG: D-alanyl-D-alanine carboxypeptidase (penicillin-binding protein 5/6) [Parcubacteria group bacterium LiPW_39]